MSLDPKLYQQLIETFKEELQEQHQKLISELLKLEQSNKHSASEILKNLFRLSHNIKGEAKCVAIESIASISHHLEDLFSEWRNKQSIPNKEQINHCLMITDNMLIALEDHLQGDIKDYKTYLKQPMAHNIQNGLSDDVLRISTEKIEALSTKINDLSIFQLKIKNWLNTIASSMAKKKGEERDLNQPNPFDVIDSGEQLLNQFSRTLTDLNQDLLDIRLLPISQILLPLKRMTRDLGAQLNKSVDLYTEGEEVELDKSILDLMKDPLNHLIRNAIDHGIESDEVRKSLNKPIPAKIKIIVTHIAAKIKLLIKDDGCGIDIEKLKKKLVENHILDSLEVDTLEKNEILEYIFHSGISTKSDKISEISGRGVGLDVVRKNIKKAKGNLRVTTEINKGTTFTISLPLTLATSRGVLVSVEDMFFMLPTSNIEALYEIKVNDIKLVDNKRTYIINNKPIIIRSLKALLGYNQDIKIDNSVFAVLVCDDEGSQSLLLVDDILDEYESVIKPLPKPLNQLQQYIGVTLNGEGAIVLVLNIPFFIRKNPDKSPFIISHQEQKAPINKVYSVLIVDDSMTTRSLTENALSSAGFITATARDGLEAFNYLRSKEFDCVVTDIEMPNMDGFELTKKIREIQKELPVVVVTSKSKEKDKHKALTLGANAYLVKSQFDTRILIETVSSLLCKTQNRQNY